MLSGKGRDMLMEGGAERSMEEEQPTASPENFLMKLVDVNRTSKGTKSGGLQSLSAMVVVGNSRVSLQAGKWPMFDRACWPQLRILGQALQSRGLMGNSILRSKA